MTKLYELLAVEPDLRGKATAIINEVRGLFDAGQAHFLGQFRKYQLIVEGEDTYPEEHTELATTVEAELARVFEQVGAWIDVSVGKEIANTEARDTILIDGTPLLGELPATALLNLEGKLAELRRVYEAIPTLPPGQKWDFDEQKGIYVSDPVITNRMKKQMKTHVLYEATLEHPAQVQPYNEDAKVGEWETVSQSGMITIVDKRDRLGRLDNLLYEVKKARQRANDIETKPDSIGMAAKLFAYIETREIKE
ncbi:hypothetical protein LCGC14_1506910 [marine sediment metagenome]|uniref:Uncharacterized protein n=1 Tax=marine sediment metagenome TaxID=412755 RepID=A0A0F9J2H4_9ZZZZ